jgi:transcriptional regulator with XRE-family HTH domain
MVEFARYTGRERRTKPVPDELPRKTLREWREENYLTLKELAEKIGVRFQTVWNWEHGRAKPEFRNVRALAQALNISPKQIIFIEQEDKE